MVWVGTDGEQREVKGHDEGVWLPDSSVTHKPFAVDFDLLVKNIKVNKNNAQDGEPGNKAIVLSVCLCVCLCVCLLQALSVLAGEGSAAVSSTPRGARLKVSTCTLSESHESAWLTAPPPPSPCTHAGPGPSASGTVC